jgi:exonuclease SbcD
MLEDLFDQLNVTLPSPLEGQLKDTDIREALEEAHFPTATVAQETQRETACGWSTEEITPLDPLKKYLESKKLPPREQRCCWNTGRG